MVAKNLSQSTCPIAEEIKAQPTLRDLRIDIRMVLKILGENSNNSSIKRLEKLNKARIL